MFKYKYDYYMFTKKRFSTGDEGNKSKYEEPLTMIDYK